MEPRWLMLGLCISVSIVNAYSVAFSTLNEYLVATDGRSRRAIPRTDKSSSDLLDGPIKMTEMRARSEIALRYARTSVTTIVQNHGRRPQEYTFNMLLPETAFITGFTMVLGEKSYKAFVKEKEEAKNIYTEAVSQGNSAAHIATKARDSNHFEVTVNVEGNSTAIFTLKYEEFLVRRKGVYNHAINLHPGDVVEKMEIIVHIKESQKITKLRVPEVRTGNEVDATEKDAQNMKAVIKKSGTKEREVTITFTPDKTEQKRLAEIYVEKTKVKTSSERYIGYSSDEDENEEDSKKILGQFVVQYDVERSNNNEILVNDGYFVHFLAPSSLTPLSKHVVFVLDTSASMAGAKIEQLRAAMKAILSDLKPNDYFNIVEFNSGIKVHELNEADNEPTWNEEYFSYFTTSSSFVMVAPALASPENIAKGKVIVSRFSANGATDIYVALSGALNLIKGGVGNKRKTGSVQKEVEPVIIFLTDGDPTVGNTDVERIVSLITEKNSGEKRTSLYSLAFGEDADRSFLRKLSLRNEGFMRHIYEAADAALQLHDFYRQVSSPVLSNVQFLYPSKQIKEGSLSRNQFRTINEGSEVAVVGQLAEGVSEMTPRIRGLHATENGYGRSSYDLSSKVSVNQTKDEYLPLERLWAYLTIKQLLDKHFASDNDDSDDENSTKKKALDIALKYSFVTPLTSLVVVKLIETKPVHAKAGKRRRIDSTDAFLPIGSPTAMRAPDISESKSMKNGISFAETVPANTIRYSIATDYSDMKTVALFSSSSTKSKTQLHYQSVTPGTSKAPVGRIGAGLDHETSFLEFGQKVSSNVLDIYHLQEFKWTISVLDALRDAFRIITKNGSYTYLKLTTDINPPRSSKGDEKCDSWKSTRFGGGNVCVYITRCFAARNITAEAYLSCYCTVNDGYAGVCCPRSQVDKTL